MTCHFSTDVRELFNRISQHDTTAYEELFNRYYDPIFSTALNYCKIREVAEDVTQQVFLKVWERRENLSEVDNPLAWLHTAAKYQVLNALEKELLRKKYLKDLRAHFNFYHDSPMDLMIRQQQTENYHTALRSLSPRQLEVYRLSREHGMTYQKIADRLGIGRETVKHHMAEALRSLRTVIGKQGSLLVIFVSGLIK